MVDRSKTYTSEMNVGSQERASAGGAQPELNSFWATLRRRFWPEKSFASGHELLGKLTPQLRARLLYEYCVTSEKKVSETVHSLFIIAEHYAAENPDELKNPEVINGIPPFFTALTAKEKAEYCYNQVTETLSLEAMPVTVESLRATKRREPDNPWSSYAGRFVRRVTGYVVLSLLVMAILYFLIFTYLGWFTTETGEITKEGNAIQWIAFGCIGALVHLLNHALTATRLQTFEISEARKIGPRILLGGIFGFVVPWILPLDSLPTDTTIPAGPIAAFFGGYSVRFSIGLLERLLAALFPETKPRA